MIQNEPTKFLLKFICLFGLLYGFNLVFIGITTLPGIYWPWLDKHANYIDLWRQLNITLAANLLKLNGYDVVISKTGLKNKGYSGFRLVYSCLGYGVLSCFAAFIFSFPKRISSKLWCLMLGIILFQFLNIVRLYYMAVYYRPDYEFMTLDHHDIFNYTIYACLILLTYQWIRVKPHL